MTTIKAKTATADCLPAHNGMKVGRVIRTPHERARGHIEETFCARDIGIAVELLGRDVFNDWQVFRSGTDRKSVV